MMPGRDSRTRYPGVFARHQEKCRFSQEPDAEPKDCTCKPSYYGVVHNKATGKKPKTARFPRLSEARTARDDLAAQVRSGAFAREESSLTLGQVKDRFIPAARAGVALNKWGKRYRPRAVDDMESSLKQIPEQYLKKRCGAVTRGDVQHIADKATEAGLSGSTVRSRVNALRSLYRYAQNREYVSHDPAALVQLPAVDEKPRDRVATPTEFAQLLDALELRGQVPFAIAGYAGGRHQEIRPLDWTQVLFDLDALDLQGLKSDAAVRVVPMVKPLRSILRREWLAQGRPKDGKVCPPRRVGSKSGMVDLSHVQKQARDVWEPAGLVPIGLHESRHTFATWLDHAGVSPKLINALMGHKSTPKRLRMELEIAPITLDRYTHVLPDALVEARDQLDAYLAKWKAKADKAAKAGNE